MMKLRKEEKEEYDEGWIKDERQRTDWTKDRFSSNGGR